MFRQLKKAATFAAAVLATTTLVSTAQAADYPEKAITLVVPYGAGGASDLAGRALAETARNYTDEQPVVVVNKTGNGGMNGARYVTEQKPDGYTLLLSRVGMALYPAVYTDSPVGWDDYTFLGILESTPMILAVNANSDIKTVDDLLAKIKSSNGATTYAASGPTAIDGFTVQALLADADLDPLSASTLVPYKGGSALAAALLGGHVDFLAIAAGSLMPHIEAGKMRALMVYSPKRMDALPDVPTAKELGYNLAGQVDGWSALFAPKNLPEDVVAKWKDILSNVATNEQWLDLAKKRGSVSVVGDQDPAAFVKSQYELYNGMAKKFGYIQ
ncbi:ABC transporter substrate-binding protein [Thalassospira lucentensis]|uniref:ABC transporter substrate-binding protein n=1 Tax=Thalassospira lucentensis TaxID=168935 RepID=A0A154L8W5_9PROT|nr:MULTISPECIES: tripartite tricarboxylate transporter substrate binding protein [Thalassospira]KZB67005.1 ABC transporter substrate-binding protein [Thalassospira lucentensis]MAZ34185.1 tripartite tricarboxylate transporter substrate binding protein [Thalassospira sp.]MBO9507060.1 tripartite tricarboxylate transporter substrate binding protein [Thalassospira sp. A3_1]MCH2273206.1 tripartite tricarboxylate transporter substrate binding protein [Thalassospira sp.]